MSFYVFIIGLSSFTVYLYCIITGNPAPPMQAVLQPQAGTIQSRACLMCFCSIMYFFVCEQD